MKSYPGYRQVRWLATKPSLLKPVRLAQAEPRHLQSIRASSEYSRTRPYSAHDLRMIASDHLWILALLAMRNGARSSEVAELVDVPFPLPDHAVIGSLPRGRGYYSQSSLHRDPAT